VRPRRLQLRPLRAQHPLLERDLPVTTFLAVVLAASWSLQVEREPNALACADEAGLRRAIAERLGHDPFVERQPSPLGGDAAGDRTLVVRFSLVDQQPHALVLLTQGGRETGRRALSSRSPDCNELGGAVALAAAIVIDPLVLSRPTVDAGVGEPGPAPQTVEPTPLPPPPPPPPIDGPADRRPIVHVAPPPVELPPPPRPTSAVWLGLSAGLSLAQVPSPAGVGELVASWETKSVQLALRFGVTTPGRLTRGSGSVNALLLDGGLDGCLRWSRFGLCLVTRVGAWQTWATDYPGLTGTQSAPFLAAGLAPFVDVPVTFDVRLRIRATLFAQFARITTTVGGLEAWSSPPLGVSVSAEALFRAWGADQP
jgi:hypothetical protein